jgi:hypothetical protein
MFIDDNPMNLGEAQHYVPGLQVANERFIPDILANPLFKGKDDRELKRLKQYQLLERRQAEEQTYGADNTEFLRGSGLTVTIEHDLEPHIDRAVELINRTNQLNFTKTRLPEAIEEARAALRELLGGYSVQAGIIRVKDRFGDYGYCGLYIMQSGGGWKKLVHFCFSCRILNMGVESWLYRRLGRPQLRVAGEVLTDVIHDKRKIDWITVTLKGGAEEPEAAPPALDYFYARGGCDLLAVSHYFSIVARELHGEFSLVRNGANLRLDHSVFARYGLLGLDKPGRQALHAFGFRGPDFETVLHDLPPNGKGVWLLSFLADVDNALYRHRATGAVAPLALGKGIVTNMRDLTTLSDAESGVDPEFLAMLRKDFEYIGCISQDDFNANLRLLLSRAPAGTRIFILMANETIARVDKPPAVIRNKKMLNEWLVEIAPEFPGVELLPVRDFVNDEREVITVSHFDRMVYYRIAQHIMKRLQHEPAAAAGDLAPGDLAIV